MVRYSRFNCRCDIKARGEVEVRGRKRLDVVVSKRYGEWVNKNVWVPSDCFFVVELDLRN